MTMYFNTFIQFIHIPKYTYIMICVNSVTRLLRDTVMHCCALLCTRNENPAK